LLNDARGVKIGFTNASLFAYVADGHNGLRVLQLTSPERTPWYEGFSPRPAPQLIATYHTHGPALAVSKGLDRDRAVDESGYQVSVFGRIGARPFNLEEMQRLYLRDGQIYTVTDAPPGPPAPARCAWRAGWSIFQTQETSPALSSHPLPLPLSRADPAHLSVPTTFFSRIMRGAFEAFASAMGRLRTLPITA